MKLIVITILIIDTFSSLIRINNSNINNNDSSDNSSNSDNDESKTYLFASKGISNPMESAKYAPTKYNLTKIRPPPNWVLRYPNGTYTKEFPPINPCEDEHFKVWMHTAGLPIFRKLYGKNETRGLEVGYYQVNIDSGIVINKIIFIIILIAFIY